MSRSSTATTLHDSILNLAASLISDYEVHKNPDGEKNRWIEDPGQKYYPDIMLVPRGQKNSTIIIEVETDESVNDDHADEQWKFYARLNRAFYLLVPGNSLEEAKRICQRK